MEKKKEVFIVSQIGEEGSAERTRADEITKHIIEPVAAEFGLTAKRSDQDPTPGPITTQLLTSILEATAVVIDLTGRNPNVFYELCFAQCFGVPVVVLADKAASLPFDVKDERTIVIGDQGVIGVSQADRAKTKLRETLQLVVDESYEPRSMITQVARVQTLEKLSPTNPFASELQAVNGRLDEVLEKLNEPVRRPPTSNAYKMQDLQQLMNFVAVKSDAGAFTSNEVGRMKTDKTSITFDEWVNGLINDIESRRRQREDVDINESDFEDIPF